MESKVIGAAVASAAVIALDGIVEGKRIMRPLVGVLFASFLLAVLAAAGLPNVAGNLAIVMAGTIVFLYGPGLMKEIQAL